MLKLWYLYLAMMQYLFNQLIQSLRSEVILNPSLVHNADLKNHQNIKVWFWMVDDSSRKIPC